MINYKIDEIIDKIDIALENLLSAHTFADNYTIKGQKVQDAIIQLSEVKQELEQLREETSKQTEESCM